MKILWATKIGDPDYKEDIITEDETKIEQAKKWAIENGYDRLRVADIDLKVKPNFAKTVKKF